MMYELILVLGIQIIYNFLYEKFNKALLNHQCMLLSLGLIVLSRLNPERATKQLLIAALATFLTALIPFFNRKFDFWQKLKILYAVLGITALGLVFVGGRTQYGAKISLSLGPVSIQPNEVVKILFVLGLSCALCEAEDWIDKLKLSIVALLHIGLLVISKDLGGASILLVIYLLLFFLAFNSYFVLIGGTAMMVLGFIFVANHMTHVQNRMKAWADPLSVIDGAGYQVSQSLFAIGSGGWFGSGLMNGMPQKIPVVSKDFIFAAICEEFGAVFAICLIFAYVSCFILIMNLALQKKDMFQSLLAAGLGLSFGFQVFLSIGGTIKLIPSTGVTLPFISAGGSSLVSSFVAFAIIQGMGMKKRTRRE
jgi:cell division protein FtsW (lipid II flippase)